MEPEMKPALGLQSAQSISCGVAAAAGTMEVEVIGGAFSAEKVCALPQVSVRLFTASQQRRRHCCKPKPSVKICKEVSNESNVSRNSPPHPYLVEQKYQARSHRIHLPFVIVQEDLIIRPR